MAGPPSWAILHHRSIVATADRDCKGGGPGTAGFDTPLGVAYPHSGRFKPTHPCVTRLAISLTNLVAPFEAGMEPDAHGRITLIPTGSPGVFPVPSQETPPMLMNRSITHRNRDRRHAKKQINVG